MDAEIEGLVLSPPDWPDKCRSPRPSDLTEFIAQGFGLGAPAILRPYGRMPQNSFYDFEKASGHPMSNAPLTESAGGTLYFDDGVEIEALIAAIGVMGVYATERFVAYADAAHNPVEERYLHQLRLISHSAIVSLWGVMTDHPLEPQKITVMDAIKAFVAGQKQRWNSASYTYSPQIAGTAGGDGDWAKESLAFGFHVENTYWGVYRVWSRPWLVTK
jgi:hypothetical protein